ncbi:PaaX family transcriptional regulator C-terminal domain-containing protein [Shimia biformata]|uniref:PaaX family transcriptional regulator C-terminal domain-containing protein n=1 Tax=Shimia biformata TaxID=1294299 RepID=UPI00194F58B3|nr:PaaX family transcriptional regulator C-terminal domain-containing protein [Shimia biformata]
MTQTDPEWFQTSVAALTQHQTLRVWSVIVTLFGDLALGTDSRVSGALMSRILEPAGLRPEAIRVALHRLRGEGWITSQRRGRTSHYALTRFGVEQSEAASPRIYSRAQPALTTCHVAVLPPMSQADRTEAETPLLEAGYSALGSGVYFGTVAPPENPDLFCIGAFADDMHLPGWLRNQLGTPSRIAAYRQLEAALDLVAEQLPKTGLTPLQTASLRVLIVHDWRRVLLSHADLPDSFFPDNWPGGRCRAKVMDLLDRLPRPALDLLEEDLTRQAA